MCLDIFEKYPKEKYDLILVDEAQDFHKNWYEALCFAKKDEGQIFFFYDPFQEQIQHSMITDLEKAEDIMKFPLKLNFRNTWEITDLLQKLIKKFFPEKTAIVYQFVHWRNIHKDHAKRILPKNVNCDYFFVFDQKSKKFLNFLKTKFIISGSVKNNEISTSKRKKLYDIMFISESFIFCRI